MGGSSDEWLHKPVDEWPTLIVYYAWKSCSVTCAMVDVSRSTSGVKGYKHRVAEHEMPILVQFSLCGQTNRKFIWSDLTVSQTFPCMLP